MSTRRRRRRSRKHGTTTLICAVGLAALASYRAGLVLAVAVAATGGILITLGILAMRRPGFLQPGKVTRAPARPKLAAVEPRARASATSAKTGHRNPRMLMISELCASDQCALCPGGKCECSCQHDPAEIIARNREAFDAAASGDVPPF